MIYGRPAIADFLGVSVSTLRKWRERYNTDRFIYRVGGRWASTAPELRRMLEEMREGK